MLRLISDDPGAGGGGGAWVGARMTGALLLAGFAAAGVGCALAGESGSGDGFTHTRVMARGADRRGDEVLQGYLARFKGAERGRIIPVTEEPVAQAFPAHLFYVLRFRQYPVPTVEPPEPLGLNNLFVVKPDGSVERLGNARALEGFLRATLAPVTTEIRARVVTKAWLRLAQEFHQDGMFEFGIPDQSVTVVSTADGGLHVTGKAVVTPRGGNAGEMMASLTFDQAGRLAAVSESASIQRGLRPICQSTRLLDPDPIVRGTAEQGILVMGRGAKEYLDEQRELAGPELREAIDRIWQRIAAEER